MRATVLMAALLAATIAGGCRQSEAPEPAAGAASGATATTTAAAGQLEGMTTTDAVVDPDVAKLAIEEPIAVSITDSGIQVKGSPVPGATQFQVTNNGTQPHNLVIEGPGVKAQLDAPLAPLEVRSITANLQAGAYRLYCPMEPDRLSTQLVVEAPVQ
jgi:hypothetical protein